MTMNEGDGVVLQSDVSGDGSYYLFTWSKINDSLPSHVKNDARQLAFDSINRTDEGSYQVVLRDNLNCSSQTRSFSITVNCKCYPENSSVIMISLEIRFFSSHNILINCCQINQRIPV